MHYPKSFQNTIVHMERNLHVRDLNQAVFLARDPNVWTTVIGSVAVSDTLKVILLDIKTNERSDIRESAERGLSLGTC